MVLCQHYQMLSHNCWDALPSGYGFMHVAPKKTFRRRSGQSTCPLGMAALGSRSAQMKQIWAPTTADPSRSWTVRGALGLPAHVRVAEGPAKIIDGKVKLFICTDGNDEEAVLDTHEAIAELHETMQKEKLACAAPTISHSIQSANDDKGKH